MAVLYKSKVYFLKVTVSLHKILAKAILQEYVRAADYIKREVLVTAY